MTYHYDFDRTSAGDFSLTREDFLILQEAYGFLREGLEVWNRRALEHGAVNPPYKQEVDDLTHMIEWGNDQLSQSSTRGVVVFGISVGSLRYAKAALMVMIRKRELDCAEKVQAGWPGGALKSLTDRIEKVRDIAKDISYEPSDVLWEVISRDMIAAENSGRTTEWDVFISHASEDKEEFARPLAEGLRSRGLKVWFDEFTLTIGDSLRRSIDRGLAQSRFGIVVISPNFLRKEWPQKELDGLVAREVNGTKVILPVWHRIGADQIRAYSPTLADRVAASSDKGLDYVIAELVRAIRRGDQPQKPSAEIGRTRTANAPVAAEVVDLWVNTEYPQKSGLVEKLKADGYDLKWERASDEATSIDLEGWELVIIDRPDGTRARLKIHDLALIGGYIVLLKRKKGFKAG